MPQTFSGDGGASKCDVNSVDTAAIQAGAVTPAKTQMGALPSSVRATVSNGFGSTGTSVRRFTTFVTQGTDITAADSAVNGTTFTINTNGVYAMNYLQNLNNVGQRFGISKNASSLSASPMTLPLAEIVSVVATISANYLSPCGSTQYLSAGTIIRCQDDAPVGAVAVSIFDIQRVA